MTVGDGTNLGTAATTLVNVGAGGEVFVGAGGGAGTETGAGVEVLRWARAGGMCFGAAIAGAGVDRRGGRDFSVGRTVGEFVARAAERSWPAERV
jgi:hypothetical protein